MDDVDRIDGRVEDLGDGLPEGGVVDVTDDVEIRAPQWPEPLRRVRRGRAEGHPTRHPSAPRGLGEDLEKGLG
jgi:hypothetical protein